MVGGFSFKTTNIMLDFIQINNGGAEVHLQKNRIWLILTILLLVLKGGAFPLTKEEKIADWQFYCQTILANYPYFEVNARVTGRDWRDSLQELEKRVLESEDDLSFYEAIQYATATLQNGHTHIIRPESYANYASYYTSVKRWKDAFTAEVKTAYDYWQEVVNGNNEFYAFDIRYIAGSYIVTRVGEDIKDLPIAAEVLAIDGQNVDEYILEKVKTTQILLDPITGKRYVNNLSLPEGAVKLTIKKDNKIQDVVVETITNIESVENYTRPATTTNILESDKIAYLKIPSLSGYLIDNDKEMLLSFFREIKDYPYLIIDIRGNGGGSDYYWMNNIMAPLIDEPVVVQTYTAHRNASFIRSFYNARLGLANNIFRRSKAVLESLPNLPSEVLTNDFADPMEFKYTIKPKNSVGYQGQIILLVDGGVYSAAETFAMVAKHSDFAYLVGTRTGGDGPGIDPVFFSLPHSKLVIRMAESIGLNPDGAANEEEHTLPHLWVAPEPEYYIASLTSQNSYDEDRQLKTVLELIATDNLIANKIAANKEQVSSIMEHLFSGVSSSTDQKLSHFQGKTISEVRIYGAYATNYAKLEKLIDLKPGETVEVKKLRMLEDRLNATGAYAQAAINLSEDSKGEVIVKIQVKEGFLFFLTPYDAFMTVMSDISSKSLTGKIYNINGGLQNFSITASIPNERLELSWETPLIFNNTYQTSVALGSLKYGNLVTTGSEKGRGYLLRDNYLRAGISLGVAPATRIYLQTAYFQDTCLETDTLSPHGLKNGSYYEVTLGINQTIRNFYTLQTMHQLNSSLTLVGAGKEIGYRLSTGLRSYFPVGDKLRFTIKLNTGLAETVPYQRLSQISSNSLPAYTSITMQKFVLAGLENTIYPIKDISLVIGLSGLYGKEGLDSSINNAYLSLYGALRYRLPFGLPLGVVYGYDPLSGVSRINFGISNEF